MTESEAPSSVLPPHPRNYPLNALISHAFGHVSSPTQYSDDKRINLELEQLKKASKESEKVKLTPPPSILMKKDHVPASGLDGGREYQLHFYDSRPLTAFNYTSSHTVPQKKNDKFPPKFQTNDASHQLDPQNSKQLEDLARNMFEDLENKLNSTQKQIQQKISSYENDLESIQKQIEHLAYDSGLVDLSTPESSP
ncbi:uncharacterized protein LOC134851527 isoform X2 [Symsagittifera roscoffensis]|uniref:uncharacterized protein LOC134851527 isoform X2 n=1 Tax=Symsagittifera roscoffensis TaxID=84072 RepID=UPI00307C0A75